MASALLADLRDRAIEAGSSRGRAADRFRTGKASAIRFHTYFRDTGQVASEPEGGDRHPPSKYLPR